VTGDVSRTYDNNFRVVSQSVNGANTVNYTYDNDGLLTNAGDLSLTRDADNGLLSATTLGTVSDAWTYNTFGEPTNYTAKASGSDAYSATFTRDAWAASPQKNETLGATSHLYVYTYDASGRLTTCPKRRHHRRHIHLRRQRQPNQESRQRRHHQWHLRRPRPPADVWWHHIHVHTQRRAENKSKRQRNHNIHLRRRRQPKKCYFCQTANPSSI
jgi:hypothetical protein